MKNNVQYFDKLCAVSSSKLIFSLRKYIIINECLRYLPSVIMKVGGSFSFSEATMQNNANNKRQACQLQQHYVSIFRRHVARYGNASIFIQAVDFVYTQADNITDIPILFSSRVSQFLEPISRVAALRILLHYSCRVATHVLNLSCTLA